MSDPQAPDPLEEARTFVDELSATRPAPGTSPASCRSSRCASSARMGLLCAQVPARFGGLGASSHANGEFTAHVGSAVQLDCAAS